MKYTPSELISTLRKKISYQSILVLLLISVIMLLSFFVPKGDNPFYHGAIFVCFMVLAFMGLMIYQRRKKYLSILSPSDPTKTILEVETYLEEEYNTFRRTDVIRWIVGTILTLAMLLLIYFKPHSKLTGEVFGTCLGVICLSMMKAWILMRDGMLLQDLKHVTKDHPSEIS